MKRLTVILLALLVALSPARAGQGMFGKKIRGCGIVETKTLPLIDHTGLRVSRGIDVRIVPAEDAREITIQADRNIMPYITIEETQGKLHLSIDSKITSIRDCDIEITLPDNGKIATLKASSGAEIECLCVLTVPSLRIEASSGSDINAAFIADRCWIEASSGSDIKANIETGDCSIAASSGSDINVRGHAARGKISASSGAECNGRNLVVANCSAHASSAGEIEISCSDTLNAQASSGGEISYYGKCRTNLNTSSGGSIEYKK